MADKIIHLEKALDALQVMELDTDEASAEYTTVTYKKRRHSSDSVVLKTDVQPPDHPRGLTVIFTPINPQESLMKLNMKKVSDLLELHCPECILMVSYDSDWRLVEAKMLRKVFQLCV
ncbi:hypothetical protein HPB47_017673 [Ixodes persulcatus]|uniref:Uncharacterized protein n=1 Tax=Ixodes persulcatus TaxID=34615 RepID=A0AC60QMQ7_IXOPE|nr:hypothetical protein HPB47_017673 [Ixodes persulcatus]